MATGEITYDQNGDPNWDTYGVQEGQTNYSEDEIPIPTEVEYYDYGSGDDYAFELPTNETTQSTRNSPDKRLRSLRYPKDVISNNHYVRFFINIDEESSIVKNNSSLVVGSVDNTDQNRSDTNSPNESVINFGVAAVASLAAAKMARHAFTSKSKLRTPATVVGGVVGAAAGSALSSEVLKLTKKLKRLASVITMYLPAGINSSYSFGYEMNEDLLANLAQGQQVEAIQAAIAKDGAKALGSAASSLVRILGAQNDTVSRLSRTAKNPKKDILFREVGNREFVFDFQMTPKDAIEAIEVADIIYMFKLFAHPELLAGHGQFLYLYPAEFDIEYGFVDESGKEKVNPHLNKISSCVIQSINVSYAPNGSYQSLKDGEPIMTNLSIRFKEIETLHQERIRNGY